MQSRGQADPLNTGQIVTWTNLWPRHGLLLVPPFATYSHVTPLTYAHTCISFRRRCLLSLLVVCSCGVTQIKWNETNQKVIKCDPKNTQIVTNVPTWAICKSLAFQMDNNQPLHRWSTWWWDGRRGDTPHMLTFELTFWPHIPANVSEFCVTKAHSSVAS